MPAKFELYRGIDLRYRFRLKDSDDNVVPAAEGYESKAAALEDLEWIRRNLAGVTLDDQT
jgi:uncharacterized protein YegP (UPF0339 family)